MTLSIPNMDLIRRAGLLILVASVIAFGGLLGSAPPVAACSCVALTSWKEAVSAETTLFSGTAGQREARGVPVRVERWFQGKGAAPIVWLTAGSFNGNPGVSSSCGIEAPAAGSRWLWVAFPSQNGDLSTGLCSPTGDLSTPEGQAMLEEAVAMFAGVVPPAASEEPTPAVAAPATIEPAATPDPSAVARDQATVTILGALVVGSLILFGGVLVVARLLARRSEDPRR